MQNITEIGICSSCGKKANLLKTNNPLITGMCFDCLKTKVDPSNLKLADFFCKTFNIPFIPEKWVMINEEEPENIFQLYVEIIAEEYADTLYNDSPTGLLWDKIDKEYQRIKNHQILISKIIPIKENFIIMMEIKWGAGYTFEEYLQLENLYTNTVKRTGTTDPLVMNMIKKIAIASTKADRAMDEGDVKEAGSWIKIHADLIKSSGLEDMVDIKGGETINTVAGLCDYLEDLGFQPQFYDGATRDQVDETIKDMKQWTTKFVHDSAGFDQTFESIRATYINASEQRKTDEATAVVDIEKLITEQKRIEREAVESQFEDLDDLDDFE